jgi:hypothetical protein
VWCIIQRTSFAFGPGEKFHLRVKNLAENVHLPYDPWTRHSQFEYETYAPDDARRKRVYLWAVFPIWIAGVLLLFATSGQALRSDSSFFGFMVAVGVWSIICRIPYYLLGYAANDAVARARYENEKRQLVVPKNGKNQDPVRVCKSDPYGSLETG